MNRHSSFNREPGFSPVTSSRTAPASPSPVGVGATFHACPSCEGTGFFTSGNFHPDDPRCEATWDCSECEGTGEVEGEAPAPVLPAMTIEEAHERIAAVFGPKKQADGSWRVEA